MPTQEDIARQQQLLSAHRATLAHYTQQWATLGSAYAPPGVAAGITEARAGILQCKAALRSWGIAVEDLPDDVDPAAQPSRSSLYTPTVRGPTADFVGREAEIAQVRRVFGRVAAQGNVVAISGVRGMGGVGKTELSLAIAQQLADLFPDGQVLVELRGVSASLSPGLVLQSALRQLGENVSSQLGEEQLRQHYRSRLQGQRVLIIADDARDAEHVRPLLPPAGCGLLITSRQHFTVPGMSSTAIINLRMLPEADAVRLLHTICHRIGDYAPELAWLCGYLPLALRVSASLLAADESLNVERYLQRLTDERTRLAQLQDPDSIDLDVEASLRLSYDALDTPARAALCQLGMLASSFDLAMALGLVAVEGDAEVVVRQLYRRSLLEWDEVAERYSVHDLVRALVANELSAEERGQLKQRYVLAIVKSYQSLYKRWQTETDSLRKEQLRAQHRASAEELWRLIEGKLQSSSRRWQGSIITSESSSLAMSRFVYILQSLPSIQLDPSKDALSQLIHVANRGAFDEAQRESKSFTDAATSTDDLSGTEMIRALDLFTSTRTSSEEDIIASIDAQSAIRVLQTYWSTTLSVNDIQIMRLRLVTDHPASFPRIAQHLGYSEATVYQRYNRILKATREYLRQQNLLDDRSSEGEV